MAPDPDTARIESSKDYTSTPEGLQKRWDTEITAALKSLEDFYTQGDESIREYLGEGGREKHRLNLWFADVQTKAATLSGEPKVRARRRYADATDDVARVSADILERLLNADVERESDGFRKALRNAKGDWLRPGLGVLRFRYVVEGPKETDCPKCEGSGQMEAMPMEGMEGMSDAPGASDMDCPDCKGTGKVRGEAKAGEDVETDHVNWRDYLWSPCRTPEEIRWVAYAADMSRDALHKRFDAVLGADVVNSIPVSKREKSKDPQQDKINEVWARARVWEIWDKESEQVHWFVEGFTRVLDTIDDPLGLPNFFPSPEPLAANTTTSRYVPKSPYQLAKGLYEEAHNYTRRIRALVKTIKVVGAYAEGNEAIKRVLDDACENTLVPVKDMAALLGKDGIGNPVWVLPIEPQVEALVQLVQQRNLVRSDISEVLGLSDIMRGQQAQRVTATTDRIKARAFSMRSQTDQDEYARFASDAQRIRAHILVTKCDAATLIKRSNIEQAERMPAPVPPPQPVVPGMPPSPPPPPQPDVPNTPLIMQAIELLKSSLADYRIDVDADSLSMTDFDAVQQDAIAFMGATGQFFQQWTPLMQAGGPKVQKFAVEMFQVFASQLRGAEKFEGIIDRMVTDLEAVAAAPPPPPQPDPSLEVAKIKAQAEGVKAQAGIQQTQVDAQAHQATTAMDMEAKKADFGMKMAEMRAKAEAQAVMPNVPMGPQEAF